ncbi:MAG: hypothetical protein R3C26_06015 [Calditrichia bacterium]
MPSRRPGYHARFVNTGSTDLLVNRDSSFIQFTDGSLTYNANVAESFVISNDTSEIFFQSKQIPVGFSTGNFDVSFHLFWRFIQWRYPYSARYDGCK